MRLLQFFRYFIVRYLTVYKVPEILNSERYSVRLCCLKYHSVGKENHYYINNTATQSLKDRSFNPSNLSIKDKINVKCKACKHREKARFEVRLDEGRHGNRSDKHRDKSSCTYKGALILYSLG